MIVNYPLISQNNGLHAGEQNSTYNRSISFTLKHIKLHALTEVILEFYEWNINSLSKNEKVRK